MLSADKQIELCENVTRLLVVVKNVGEDVGELKQMIVDKATKQAERDEAVEERLAKLEKAENTWKVRLATVSGGGGVLLSIAVWLIEKFV